MNLFTRIVAAVRWHMDLTLNQWTRPARTA